MHELGVTQSILNIVLHHAEEANAARIKEINLVIGELSSIVDESVQFYWDMISEGTIAEHAALEFCRVPARLHCDACGAEFRLNPENFFCPECGSERIVITAGEEFYLESIDVDF